MTMLAVAAYLANKPSGIIGYCLVAAFVLFIAAGLASAYWRAFWAGLICAGFALFTVAFLVH